MKLSLTRSAIHDTLQRLARVIPARTTIPMLGHILMRAERGVLSLAATNLDMDARGTVAADVEEDGVFAVPGGLLAAIIAALGTDARISIDSGDSIITLKSSRTKYKLSTLPAADFSNWAIEGDWSTTFKIDAKELLRLFATVAPFASTLPAEFSLMSVFWEGDGTAFHTVSTDRKRMAAVNYISKEKFACLLDIKAISELKSLLDKIGGEISVSINSGKVAFSFVSGFVFTCRLIDAQYPDYRRVFTGVSANKNAVTMDGEKLSSLMTRLAAMASEDTTIRLEIANGAMHASVKHEHGDAEDDIACEYDEDEPIVIGFSVKYLQDMLAALSADTIQVKIADSISPTLWQALGDADDAGRRFILFPRTGV